MGTRPRIAIGMSNTAPEPSPDRLLEYCPECENTTHHAVSLEVQAAGEVKYSREPHRISRCEDCGHTQTDRLGR